MSGRKGAGPSSACVVLIFALAAGVRPAIAGGTPASSPNPSPGSGSPTCRATGDPAPSPTRISILLGISAVSPGNAWAVGWQTIGRNPATLVEHWDGQSWSVVPSPNPGGRINVLTGVSAVTADDVWASGYQFSDGVSTTLIEHWDGAKWSVVPSRSPGERINDLEAVTALSPADAWVAGYTFTEFRADRALLEHWDGSAWSVFKGPREKVGLYPFGLSAVSSNDVWAVGYKGNGPPYSPLTLHWNGTAWSELPAPDPHRVDMLQGVAAVSSGDVWAVGYASDDGSAYRTLAMHWNGSDWVVVPTPNSGSAQNYLRSVSAFSPGDVWAVGYQSSGESFQTLIEHWDGTAWSVVPSQNPRTGSNSLFSVDASQGASPAVWAVGDSYDGIRNRTLIESGSAVCSSRGANEPGGLPTAPSRLASGAAGGERSGRTGPRAAAQTEADLKVGLSDSDPVPVGQPLLYGITVKNFGPDTATNVWMSDRFGRSMQLVSAIPIDQGTCHPHRLRHYVRCDLGTLDPPSGFWETTIHVVVTPEVGGVIRNVAHDGSDADVDPPENNVAIEQTICPS